MISLTPIGIQNNLKNSFKYSDVYLGSSSWTIWPGLFQPKINLNLPYIWAIVKSLSILSGLASKRHFGSWVFKNELFRLVNQSFQYSLVNKRFIFQ